MISERRQIAERFLSEGNGEAARIRGNRVRDLNKIQSEAYRQVEEVRGAADAKATEIYAKAYNQSPEAVAFYEFTRTMQSYKSIIAENTTLVLSTGSDLFKFLKGEIDAVVRRIDERIARRLRSDLGSRPLHRIGFQLQLAFDPQFGERCNRDRNAEPSWIQRTDAPGKKFKFVRIKRRS